MKFQYFKVKTIIEKKVMHSTSKGNSFATLWIQSVVCYEIFINVFVVDGGRG